MSPITGDTTLVVAASALAVAALFRPVRGQIQAAVSATRSTSTRSPTGWHIVEVTMRPTSVSVWMQQAEGRR